MPLTYRRNKNPLLHCPFVLILARQSSFLSPPMTGEEKFLLGIKDAAAIVSLLIVIVVLIAKLRECIRNPSCGGRMFVGSNLITGSDI
ncbi:hypothetical protein FCV25MIE_01121, partial [Fagus crenata]